MDFTVTEIALFISTLANLLWLFGGEVKKPKNKEEK